MEKLKVGVLISGRGSNLQALINAGAEQDYPAEIVLVVSNDESAKGLEIASSSGIPTKVIDDRGYNTRQTFDAAVEEALSEANVGLICMAGFMRLVSAWFAERWRERILNIHPSLLPAFRGLSVHERVIESGVRFTGCTVHFVRPAVDEGPIIMQSVVPVFPNDTVEALAARVLKAEHRIYPAALRMVAEGRVRISGDRVLIEGGQTHDKTLFNPSPD